MLRPIVDGVLAAVLSAPCVVCGRILDQPMAPEKRVYAANGQPQTMVANHSTLRWDLYVVYEGQDASTGLPIIKAFLNPLVAWIWARWLPLWRA